MRSTFPAKMGLCGLVVTLGLGSSRSEAGDDANPIVLRGTDRPGSASFASELESPAPARIREVGNWLSMSEAQSTLPQGVFAGAELFFARPRIGDSGTFAVASNLSLNGSDVEVVNFTFDYQASPRAYVGWRSPNTGDAVQFTFWHFDDSASKSFEVTEPSNQVFVQLTSLNTPEPFFQLGDGVSAVRNMNFNVYDVDYLKSMAFSGGRWLVTGSVGARIADIGQDVRTVVFLGTGGIADIVDKQSSFVGAGPRLTLEGRRSLGPLFLALCPRRLFAPPGKLPVADLQRRFGDTGRG